MLQHIPWVGPNYKTGINGQRTCIVGYSHHHESGESDSDDLTEWVVLQVIKGELGRNSFFPPIAGYFGFSDQGTFWNRVMFFNFLPDVIGKTEQRYDTGRTVQIARGKERFLRIIREAKPNLDKVFVFTTKGWRDLPRTIEEESGKEKIPLSGGFPKFSWGTYAAGDHVVMAFGLRHPQFAPGELMKSAVRQILDKPLIGNGSS
jgi:hypothetical protein